MPIGGICAGLVSRIHHWRTRKRTSSLMVEVTFIWVSFDAAKGV